MVNKKIIIALVLIIGMFGFIKAQVNFNPIYTSDRFQPSDKFHAGCHNQMDVVFELTGAHIDGVSAEFIYNNDQIDILKIAPEGEEENNLTYSIEDNKIKLNKLKTSDVHPNKILFKLFFKSDKDLKEARFEIVTGSYVLDNLGNMFDVNKIYDFNFEAVSECDPDIVAPSIEMLFPVISTGEYVALDSYFKFKIFDHGKGVNKGSINILLDGINYDLSNIEHDWDGDVLTIYPDNWLSIGSEFELSVEVQDKQVYGKSNVTEELYKLETSTGLYLLNDIDPVQFRKLVNKEKYYQGSEVECQLLKNMYFETSDDDKEIVSSINKRLSCGNIDKMDSENNKNIKDGTVDIKHNGPSVFAVLGWLLLVMFGFIKLFKYLSKPHSY